ncbi:hypothetical protein PTQ27_11360 [Mannheimia sp. AT1]|uniref:Uncharacterized protein n=1 Tax=Mannheimia cairinae TaxID=3025936 RepID=A0ABT5MUB5_9PAST|nr:hypothetical protein [Mannheimia cairinae]MDD0825051.1 hypothetical protein [Mannheimia cairinae]MDD0825694.1 hypothetical protein [Mannheimia cairinae]
MEWKGIDLAGSKQSKWVLTSYTTIKQFGLILLFIVGINLIFTFYYLQKKQEIYPLATQLNQLKAEKSALIQKIADLDNNKKILPFIKGHEIEQSFELIKNFPLKNGGINSILFYLDNNLYLKITGKLSSQQDFQMLEQFLREQDLFELKVDQINLNHNNETHLIFTVKHKGIK